MHLQFGEKNNTLSFINEIMTRSFMLSTRNNIIYFVFVVGGVVLFKICCEKMNDRIDMDVCCIRVSSKRLSVIGG